MSLAAMGWWDLQRSHSEQISWHCRRREQHGIVSCIQLLKRKAKIWSQSKCLKTKGEVVWFLLWFQLMSATTVFGGTRKRSTQSDVLQACSYRLGCWSWASWLESIIVSLADCLGQLWLVASNMTTSLSHVASFCCVFFAFTDSWCLASQKF